MNREILFRGKRKDTGRWVEGYYMKHINRTPCVINDSVKEKDVEHIIFYDGFSDWNMPRGIEGVYIDPNTLGQYTGLTDKHGRKIFEGDVMEFDAYGLHYKGEVFFDEGAFCVACNHPTASTFLIVALQHDAICVGNIHDDHELLKGE